MKLIRIALLMCLILAIVEAQTNSTTPSEKSFAGRFGVGYGVVIVFVFFLLGIIVCISGRATSMPMIFVIIGTILPIIVFLILYLLPKEADRPAETEGDQDETQVKPILTGLFLLLILILTVAALGFLLFTFLFTRLQAQSYDNGTSGVRIEGQKILSRQE